jgi:hypothetical protein
MQNGGRNHVNTPYIPIVFMIHHCPPPTISYIVVWVAIAAGLYIDALCLLAVFPFTNTAYCVIWMVARQKYERHGHMHYNICARRLGMDRWAHAL